MFPNQFFLYQDSFKFLFARSGKLYVLPKFIGESSTHKRLVFIVGAINNRLSDLSLREEEWYIPV